MELKIRVILPTVVDVFVEEAIQEFKHYVSDAVEVQVHAGAIPETVFVQTVETIPLSYMPTKALRIKVPFANAVRI